MKSYKNLYKKFEDIHFIKQSIMDAANHKKNRRAVKYVLANLDTYAARLQDMLVNETFTPTKVEKMTRWDVNSGKYRDIYPPVFFPDQCVHWCLINATRDVFMRGMYEWNGGNVPGRGTHYGVRYVQKVLKKHPTKTKYCLYMDIRHYYQSINQDALMAMLEKRISDRKILRLYRSIIYSVPPEEGLPLGNYTSQWLANFYLQEFDHKMKEEWKAPFYYRNVDDMIVIGSSKKKLHRIRKQVQKYLAELGMELKPNYQVFVVDKRGIDYLGYVFYHGYTKVRAKNFLKLVRNVRKVQKHMTAHDAAGLLSRAGQLKWCNGESIRRKYLSGGIIRACKAAVRKEQHDRLSDCEHRGRREPAPAEVG